MSNSLYMSILPPGSHSVSLEVRVPVNTILIISIDFIHFYSNSPAAILNNKYYKTYFTLKLKNNIKINQPSMKVKHSLQCLI